MNVPQTLLALHQESKRRTYIIRLEVLEHSRHLLKARLYIAPDLFVQVYRNDRYDTTNLVLVHARRRLYARDKLGGAWHRHPASAPRQHDTSDEGRRQVSLSEFLDEVEEVLAMQGLP